MHRARPVEGQLAKTSDPGLSKARKRSQVIFLVHIMHILRENGRIVQLSTHDGKCQNFSSIQRSSRFQSITLGRPRFRLW